MSSSSSSSFAPCWEYKRSPWIAILSENFMVTNAPPTNPVFVEASVTFVKLANVAPAFIPRSIPWAKAIVVNNTVNTIKIKFFITWSAISN